MQMTILKVKLKIPYCTSVCAFVLLTQFYELGPAAERARVREEGQLVRDNLRANMPCRGRPEAREEF